MQTRAEQLQAEENKAHYEQRCAYRQEIIKKLSFLLREETHPKVILNNLTELGLKTEEGFAEKTADDMRESIHELISQLEEASSGVVKVTTATTTETAETAEGADKIRATLEELTEGRFLSVEAMNEALKGLPGVTVEIPADEIARLNGLFPNELSPETLAKIKNVKNQTEEEKGPLIMQLPAKVMVDGQERPFTIATMQEIMRKAANADSSLKPLCLSDYVPEDVKSKVWDSALTVWTSACLKGSKSKNFSDQLKHRADILGAEYGIEADMILAMALRYISGKEELMRQDFMRLNTRDAAGAPLYVYVYDDGLSLGSYSFARSHSGVGASFRISS